MFSAKYKNDGFSKGSALILTVVLTSILAIVGIMFVLSSRVDKLATSSLTDERQLNNAVDSILAKLSEELILDVPGVAGQEFYDYAGGYYNRDNELIVVDKWLASIEPYEDPTAITEAEKYKWSQISDLTGYIEKRYDPNDLDHRWGKGRADDDNGQIDVWVNAEGYDDDGDPLDHYRTSPKDREFIPEYHPITLNENGQLHEQWADADGDGVADSKWIELDDFSTGKGQKVYAAIRVIDNGGMLNINTAYTLRDPNVAESNDIDGSSLMHINLAQLAMRSATDIEKAAEKLQRKRDSKFNIADPCAAKGMLSSYEENLIWRYGFYKGDYTPFDISDELELRYRYIVNQADTLTRIENLWTKGFETGEKYPITGYLSDWFKRASYVSPDVNDDYSYRHLATVYSLDRIIDPEGDVMTNVNYDPDKLDDANDVYTESDSYNFAEKLYTKLLTLADSNNVTSQVTRTRMKRELAQFAVNLVDFRDRDNDVTSLNLGAEKFDKDDRDFYSDDFVFGIEPFPVITQVAIWIDPNDPSLRDPNDPNTNPNYYGVELFNPFDREIELDDLEYRFELVVTDINELYDSNDPNSRPTPKIIESIPLYGGGISMIPDEYIVIQNKDLMYDVNFSEPNDFNEQSLIRTNFYLSSGYRVIYERDPLGGPPIAIVDQNVVDSHNLAVRRVVNVRNPAGKEEDRPADPNRYIYLDRQLIYKNWVRWDPNGLFRSYGRDFDIEQAKWWDVVYPRAVGIADSLGTNGFISDPCLITRPAMDIAIPYGPNQDLRTVGDIARIWTIGPSDRLNDPPDVDDPNESYIFDPNSIDNTGDPNDPNLSRLARFGNFDRTIGEKLRFVSESIDLTPVDPCAPAGNASDEDIVRLNLGDPLYTNIFQYLTVFDPRVDNIDNDGDGTGDNEDDNDEIKIPGRININTAPASVIAQLPWMTSDIADAVVAYRDKRRMVSGPDYTNRNIIERFLDWNYTTDEVRTFWDRAGFASIGELNLVIGGSDYRKKIRIYSLTPEPDNSTGRPYPDLTGSYYLTDADDGAENDFEERDLIFARISNLVTVRSDIFTAYILVRLGADGPQKRMVAILDRSDVRKKDDKVKIIALQSVPDPR
ncbi:MAG: hypothetical protein JW804_09375 [Sedimentisphaerales bacterium]|nr:hypothetical protein [Sedimentisphaerales bacterium]